MASESLSVAEASRRLGVSIPTVKAMFRRRDLEGFSTPGGHLRILAESLEGIRGSNGRARPSSASAPSTTLQTRRERIEFLNLEGEELRAQHELDRLRSESAEEEEQRAAGKRSQDIEREQRLEEARAERLRQERLQQETSAQQRRGRLRQQVQLALSICVSAADIPLEKQCELADSLEAELLRANVEDEESAKPIIKAVFRRFNASLNAEAHDRRMRERITESARRDIAWTTGATESDEAEAVAAARAVLSSSTAPESELRCAVKAAIAPIRDAIERRRQAKETFDAQRKESIELGIQEVGPYLERLQRASGIKFDVTFVWRLKDAVRAGLNRELKNQTPTELRSLVHEIIDGEIDQ